MKIVLKYLSSTLLLGLLPICVFGSMYNSYSSYKTPEAKQDSTLKSEVPVQKSISFTDSIRQRLASIPSDLERLDSLYKWTNDYKDVDPSISLELAFLGQLKSQEVSDQEWEMEFDFKIARNYTYLAKYDSALIVYDKIIDFSEKSGNQAKQAFALNRKGFARANQGNYAEAVQSYLESLHLYEILEDQNGIAESFISLSDILGYLDRYEEGVGYAKRALTLFEEQNDTFNILQAYRSIADNCLGTENYEDALVYTEKAVKLAETLELSPIEMASLLNSRGNVLKLLERYNESLKAYKRSNDICTALNHPGGMSATLANIADVYRRKGDYQNALPYQKKSYALSVEYGFNMNILENIDNLSTIYRELGDFENALKYREQLQMMKDSIVSVEKDQIAKELTTKYETEKKETQIALQEEQLVQKSKIQNLTFGAVALLAALLFTLFYYFRKNKRITVQLEAKNKENELLLKEIHHRVKNNLQTVSSLLSLQSESISDKSAFDAVQESKNRVASMALLHQKLYQGENLAAIEMRDYFETIGSTIIDSFGKKAENIALDIDMSKIELDVDTAVPIGLITNELITNSIKHAFPDQEKGLIRITLQPGENDLLKLIIEDNGRPSANEAVSKKDSGFGSLLIQLLTTQLGGTLETSSEGGTSTVILFPLQQKSAA
jgi:two-component sensor histidine kinase